MKFLTVVLSSLVISATSYAQNVFPLPSGNVGIGTTTPGDKLVISDGGVNAISIRAGETAGIGFNRAVTGGGIYNTAISAWQFSFRDSMFTLEGYNGASSNPWTVLKNGNVGIGTIAPMQKLSVVGGTFNVGAEGDYYGAWLSGGQSVDSYLGLGTWHSQAGYIKWFNAARRLAIYTTSSGEPLTLQENGGNVGIGTTNPMANLDVAATIKVGGGGAANSQRLMINTENGIAAGIQLFQDGLESWEMHIPSGNTALIWSNSHTERLRLDASGNMGIGTTNPTEKLSVKGKIRAQEVIVETTNWSDHVFFDSYKLQSLSEVEQHIKTEKHLPGVPSAQEVAEKGVSVGDMQVILLAKIEELTLHQIAQEKRLLAQDAKLATQAEKIATLEADNAHLKAGTY